MGTTDSEKSSDENHNEHTYIYHLVDKALWLECSSECRLHYEPLDFKSEGFIHLSTKLQLLRVAKKYYMGREDILVLKIDVKKLTEKLIWEPGITPSSYKNSENTDSEHDKDESRPEVFPHLYGSLNRDAVVGVYEIYWQGEDFMVAKGFFE